MLEIPDIKNYYEKELTFLLASNPQDKTTLFLHNQNQSNINWYLTYNVNKCGPVTDIKKTRIHYWCSWENGRFRVIWNYFCESWQGLVHTFQCRAKIDVRNGKCIRSMENKLTMCLDFGFNRKGNLVSQISVTIKSIDWWHALLEKFSAIERNKLATTIEKPQCNWKCNCFKYWTKMDVWEKCSGQGTQTKLTIFVLSKLVRKQILKSCEIQFGYCREMAVK